MQLFVLNRALERIGVITDYASMLWTTSLRGHDTVNLRCDEASLPMLAEGYFLERDDGTDLAVITRRFVHYGTKVEVEALGATCLWDRRICWGTHSFTNQPLGAIAEGLLSAGTAPQAGLDRSIEGMRTSVIVEGDPGVATTQVSWGSVAERLFELTADRPVRFGVRRDGTELQPYLSVGTDRSADVVFSPDFGDLSDVTWDRDDIHARTLAVVGGEGEGAARKIIVVDRTDGGELRELWIDADDLRSDDLTPAAYDATLAQRGLERLAELPVTSALEGTADKSRYSFPRDYDLGDTVTFRLGAITGTDTVREVTEIFEDGEERATLALGTTAPTIIDRVRSGL